ncbi:MAG TPA: hypothetical protein VFP22_09350 [Candidatus Limnocylindrales bacterium]|nr:hypothetical protein [Candidatus Limnocylindrales bacterium]
MDDRSNLRVLVFPADDVALRHEVEATVATLPDGLPESAMAATVQERLRHWYRSVEVRPRDPLAGYEDDPTHVWYVYRDGSPAAGSPTLDRLSQGMLPGRG